MLIFIKVYIFFMKIGTSLFDKIMVCLPDAIYGDSCNAKQCHCAAVL